MKKISFLICFMMVLTSSISQNNNTDSYTIQRLIIYNEKGEILLEKHKNGWMTPALRHNSKISTKKGLESLAEDFGLTISIPKLAGIFMFIPDYKPKSSFRQHYTSKLIGGKLRLPEGKLDAQWFPPHKVIEMMSQPDAKLIFAVRDMTKHILNFPDVIWGGTYRLWKENEKTKYEMIDNFYPISK